MLHYFLRKGTTAIVLVAYLTQVLLPTVVFAMEKEPQAYRYHVKVMNDYDNYTLEISRDTKESKGQFEKLYRSTIENGEWSATPEIISDHLLGLLSNTSVRKGDHGYLWVIPDFATIAVDSDGKTQFEGAFSTEKVTANPFMDNKNIIVETSNSLIVHYLKAKNLELKSRDTLIKDKLYVKKLHVDQRFGMDKEAQIVAQKLSFGTSKLSYQYFLDLKGKTFADELEIYAGSPLFNNGFIRSKSLFIQGSKFANMKESELIIDQKATFNVNEFNNMGLTVVSPRKLEKLLESSKSEKKKIKNVNKEKSAATFTQNSPKTEGTFTNRGTFIADQLNLSNTLMENSETMDIDSLSLEGGSLLNTRLAKLFCRQSLEGNITTFHNKGYMEVCQNPKKLIQYDGGKKKKDKKDGFSGDTAAPKPGRFVNEGSIFVDVLQLDRPHTMDDVIFQGISFTVKGIERDLKKSKEGSSKNICNVQFINTGIICARKLILDRFRMKNLGRIFTKSLISEGEEFFNDTDGFIDVSKDFKTGVSSLHNKGYLETSRIFESLSDRKSEFKNEGTWEHYNGKLMLNNMKFVNTKTAKWKGVWGGVLITSARSILNEGDLSLSNCITPKDTLLDIRNKKTLRLRAGELPFSSLTSDGTLIFDNGYVTVAEQFKGKGEIHFKGGDWTLTDKKTDYKPIFGFISGHPYGILFFKKNCDSDIGKATIHCEKYLTYHIEDLPKKLIVGHDIHFAYRHMKDRDLSDLEDISAGGKVTFPINSDDIDSTYHFKKINHLDLKIYGDLELK